MKRLVPIPPDSVEGLKKDKKKEWGYQFVSVTLKDGRRFDPAVASEGYIIEVKGHMDVPFAAEDVESVAVTHKHWNFRREKLDRSRNTLELAVNPDDLGDCLAQNTRCADGETLTRAARTRKTSNYRCQMTGYRWTGPRNPYE